MADNPDHREKISAPQAKQKNIYGFPWKSFLRDLTSWGCVLYLVLVVLLWIVVWSASDIWWVATLLLFGAHWLWALPLALLVPASLIFKPKRLWMLLVAILILVFPVMNFNIPWGHFFAKKTDAPHVRVLSCNTHQDELDARALGKMVAAQQPDIVALQEFQTHRLSHVFPKTDWYVLTDGELTIASHWPLRRIKDLIEPDDAAGGGHAACYLVEAPSGPIYFINLHLASPHPSFNAVLSQDPSAHEQVRMNFLARAQQAAVVSQFASKCSGRVLLAGDFNTPVNSNIYRRYYSGFEDAFSSTGWGFGYTYFFGKRSQVRIDHILGGQGWHCQNCTVAESVGSKHHPIIADMY